MKTIISIVIALSAFSVNGQITVTNGTFPSVGDTLRYRLDPNPTGIFMTPPGGNQIWDFSSLNGGSIETEIWLSASTGSGASNFPDADLHLAGSQRDVFFKKTATAIQNLGSSGLDPFGLVSGQSVRFMPPFTERRAPMNFFDIQSGSSNQTWVVPVNAVPAPILGSLAGVADSVRFRISKNRIDVVDGWGLCKLPVGQFDVLREKRTTYTSRAIDVHTFLGWIDISTTPGSGLTAFVGTDTLAEAHFFSATEKEEIAMLTLGNDFATAMAVRFKHLPPPVSATDFSEKKYSFQLAPNPVFDQLRMEFFEPSTGGGWLDILDSWGQKRISKTIFGGDRVFSIDLSDCPPGLFFIQVFDENGNLRTVRKVMKF